MVYQRKKRAHEQQEQLIPQVQPSLFTAPDVDSDDVDPTHTPAAKSDRASMMAKFERAEQNGYTFADIAIFAPNESIQRRRDLSMAPPKRHGSLSLFGPVQRDSEISSVQTRPISPSYQGMVARHKRDEAVLHMPMKQPLLQRRPLSMQLPIQRDVPAGMNSMPQTAGSAGENSVDLKPKGSGRPLPKQVSDNFVQSGYPEVQQARVHVDDEATRSIQSHGYTMKNDIVVQSSGANDPQLLGHEATHVVQQSQMALKPDVNGTPINANPALEQNADDNGKRVGHHQPVTVEGIASRRDHLPQQSGPASTAQASRLQDDGGQRWFPGWSTFPNIFESTAPIQRHSDQVVIQRDADQAVDLANAILERKQQGGEEKFAIFESWEQVKADIQNGHFTEKAKQILEKVAAKKISEDEFYKYKVELEEEIYGTDTDGSKDDVPSPEEVEKLLELSLGYDEKHLRYFDSYNTQACLSESIYDLRIESQKKPSKRKPFNLIFHVVPSNRADASRAFSRFETLDPVLKDSSSSSLVLSGRTPQKEYTNAIGSIAKAFGRNNRIDQVMFAGHGFTDRVYLDHDPYDEKNKINYENAINLENDDGRAIFKDLIDEIIHYMIPDENLSRKQKRNMRSRIFLNACYADRYVDDRKMYDYDAEIYENRYKNENGEVDKGKKEEFKTFFRQLSLSAVESLPENKDEEENNKRLYKGPFYKNLEKTRDEMKKFYYETNPSVGGFIRGRLEEADIDNRITVVGSGTEASARWHLADSKTGLMNFQSSPDRQFATGSILNAIMYPSKDEPKGEGYKRIKHLLLRAWVTEDWGDIVSAYEKSKREDAKQDLGWEVIREFGKDTPELILKADKLVKQVSLLDQTGRESEELKSFSEQFPEAVDYILKKYKFSNQANKDRSILIRHRIGVMYKSKKNKSKGKNFVFKVLGSFSTFKKTNPASFSPFI